MESDSQSSNKDNCSSSDSCSDIDVGNTEEHKEHGISKQEQIDRKTFYYYSHNDQNIIMLLKYTKQEKINSLKENQDRLLSSRILGEFPEDKRKTKAGPQENWGWACQIYSQRSW